MNLSEFFDELQSIKRMPILFIGSGLTKRYTSINFNWKELLINCISIYELNAERKYKWYIEKIKSEYNIQQEDSHMMYKLLGAKIETDFNLSYYEGKFEMADFEEKYSPLKFYIKTVLSSFSLNEDMEQEINLFKKLKDKILTIITTNYDTFLEDHIFIEHEKMIKQQIFTGSELGTILKIHGCMTQPDSLIITKNDYDNYYSKSKILTAKVINLFAENPIIFLGYSVTDENIRGFLQDIYSCLETQEEYDSFSKRLIVINYDPSNSIPVIGESFVDYEGIRIQLTQITISDFSLVYNEINKFKHSAELKEVRKLKNLIYEIVHDYDGEKKKIINLLNEENEEDDNEVVVVIGKTSPFMNTIGILGVTANQIIHDLVFDDISETIPIKLLVELALPNLLRGNTVLPVHKYLSILEGTEFKKDEKVLAMLDKEPKDFTTTSIRKNESFYNETSFNSLEEIIAADLPTSKIWDYIFFRAIEETTEVEELKDFLVKYYEDINSTLLRKLVCILDIRKYKKSAR